MLFEKSLYRENISRRARSGRLSDRPCLAYESSGDSHRWIKSGGSALLPRVRGNSAEIPLPLVPDRRSEINQRAVVIEVAISRANVTHERDLVGGRSQPSFSLRAILPHSTLHFPSCGSFGPLAPPRSPLSRSLP